MEIEKDKRLHFLDTEVIRNQNDWTAYTVVYRKPTHTDRYIHYNSHHYPQIKTGVIHTMVRRVEKVCTCQIHLAKKKQHLQQVFHNNGYPEL